MWYALIAQAAAEAPPPLSPDARFALALFCNPECGDEVLDTLDDALGPIAAKSGFPESAARPIRIMGIAGSEFGVPDEAFVELYGVGVDRPEALAQSQEVLIAWIAGPRDRAADTFAVAHAAFATAARRAGGWVEDLDTQRLYGADAWAALDPHGPVTDWFVVDAEPMDEADADKGLRLVTRGLRRYGDFELVVEDVPEDTAGDVSFVMNAIATDLRARPSVPFAVALATDSVRGTASFSNLRRRDSDPEAPLLRATFDGELTLPPEPGLEPEQAPVPSVAVADVGAARGVSASPAVAVAPPTLADTQQLARARFAEVVLPAFRAGLPAGEAVAVKAPFRTRAGGTEYMWVELRAIRGEELEGRLANDPYEVDGLAKGDTIRLQRAAIFDYVWKKADGSREGNTTAAFLK